MERRLLDTISVGYERTLEQDPAFALRVLADIALRALSPAVNDPTTAVQALDRMDSVLRVLVVRDLDIGRIAGSDGTVRVLLVLPLWEDFVSVALDDLVRPPDISILARRRAERLIDDLLARAPADRIEALQARRDILGSVAESVPA